MDDPNNHSILYVTEQGVPSESILRWEQVAATHIHVLNACGHEVPWYGHIETEEAFWSLMDEAVNRIPRSIIEDRSPGFMNQIDMMRSLRVQPFVFESSRRRRSHGY